VPNANHHAEFKLSITKALADQLAAALKKLAPTALTSEALDALPAGPGVYQLYVNGERVYVGKASKSLPVRLRKHHRKLSGRPIAGEVTFVCLYLDEDLEASAPEKMLLGMYEGRYERTPGEVGLRLPWNNNGFGNNDPGRRRDGSVVQENHFDAIYPINLDLTVRPTPGVRPVGDVLAELKKALPYLLRFQDPRKDKRALSDYRATVRVPDAPITVRSLIRLVIESLPDGWQATTLPGYTILYYENINYDSAQCWWRRSQGSVCETPGPRRFAPAAEIREGRNSEEEDDG
jgi:hypothetical protein